MDFNLGHFLWRTTLLCDSGDFNKLYRPLAQSKGQAMTD